MRRVRLAPSILAADLRRLADEVAAAERGGADAIHVDVMDGRFVPNLSFGPLVVEAVRGATTLPLDVHLMIEWPERTVDDYVEAGADGVTIHAEATPHPHRALARVRESGRTVGLAVNPLTPLAVVEEAFDIIDLALVMSVDPGFGGQRFLPSALRRLERLRARRDAHGARFLVQVDGGVDARTAAGAVAAGADVLVAGSAVFDGVDPERRLRELREAAETAPPA